MTGTLALSTKTLACHPFRWIWSQPAALSALQGIAANPLLSICQPRRTIKGFLSREAEHRNLGIDCNLDRFTMLDTKSLHEVWLDDHSEKGCSRWADGLKKELQDKVNRFDENIFLLSYPYSFNWCNSNAYQSFSMANRTPTSGQASTKASLPANESFRHFLHRHISFWCISYHIHLAIFQCYRNKKLDV